MKTIETLNGDLARSRIRLVRQDGAYVIEFVAALEGRTPPEELTVAMSIPDAAAVARAIQECIRRAEDIEYGALN